MKTFYLVFTITVQIEAEDENEALIVSTELSDEDIARDGEWSQDVTILDEDFEEVFRN